MAAIALATLLSGCGEGHRAKTSSRTAEGRSPASTTEGSATTAATLPVTPTASAYWSYAKLVKSLAGRTLVLPHGPVRLDGDLLECNGKGMPLETGRTRRWRRYTCTQTLFEGGVDQDVTFDVVIETTADLRVISPRYGSE